MKFMTERLILRPWQESDAADLYEYAKNPKVGPIAGWPVHTSVENSLEIIRNVLSAAETYAVCLKKDNRAIGSIGLISPMQSHTMAKDDEIEIGYWIGEPFWGNGYIPEAVRALQEHAFNDLGYNAMWCGYYDGNEKSKRAQTKCGFIYHHTEHDKPCLLMGDIRTEHFTYLTKEDWIKNNRKQMVLYIHGKGGQASEAEHYKMLFPECEVYGFDYQAFTPWETKTEFEEEIKKHYKQYGKIILIANSIGAFFLMNAKVNHMISQAFFISPIVDMEKLIGDMMLWAGVSEGELKSRNEIETSFGETLSWEYLCYVRDNPISWDVPTEILYGEKDHLSSLETEQAFAAKTGAHITVMENGEHWFHTDEQMKFLDDWIRRTWPKR